MSELIVVRHGQASLFADDYDVLSPLGERQARLLGEHWSRVDLTPGELCSGPARRQIGTARLAAEAAAQGGSPWPEARTLPGFDEHDAFGLIKAALPGLIAQQPELGQLLAQTRDESLPPAERSGRFQILFEAVMGRWLRGELEVEGNETWPEFRERVAGGLRELLAEPGRSRRVALFTSVGPIAVLLHVGLDLPVERAFQTAWRIRNASVTRFLFRADELTLDSFNTLEHLPDPSTHTHR